VHHLPEALSFPEAAFAEPLSCALHALERVRSSPGDNAVVLGAGTMGLLTLQLLRNAGATTLVVIEPVAERRAQAALLGADLVLDPLHDDMAEAIQKVAPDGVQLAVECSGNPDAAGLGLGILQHGGMLLLLGLGSPTAGLQIRPNDIVDRELAIVGAVLNPFTFQRAIDLLGAGAVQVRDLITPFALDQVENAIISARDGLTIKSMVVNNGP